MFKKITAIIILVTFCITQTGLAAPPNHQNLRQKTDDIDKTSGIKDAFKGAVVARADGRDISDLDGLLEQTQKGAPTQRLQALDSLKDIFTTKVSRRLIRLFPGKRIMPDLSPATNIAAMAVKLADLIGCNNGDLIDLTAATPMRSTMFPIMRVARRNWHNVMGEGLRHNVRPEAQIPPHTYYIVELSYPYIETINDPVDGTGRTAEGKEGGVSILMATSEGGVGRPVPDRLRIENWIYPGNPGAINLKKDSPEEIIEKIALANHRKPSAYQIWLLDRNYHKGIINAAKKLGLTVRL